MIYLVRFYSPVKSYVIYHNILLTRQERQRKIGIRWVPFPLIILDEINESYLFLHQETKCFLVTLLEYKTPRQFIVTLPHRQNHEFSHLPWRDHSLIAHRAEAIHARIDVRLKIIRKRGFKRHNDTMILLFNAM